MKRYCNKQLCQSQDAEDLVRRGQHLHDAAVYMALSNLIELAGKVFSTGHQKSYPPVLPKKDRRRGWTV